jgi:hypothetical protein
MGIINVTERRDRTPLPAALHYRGIGRLLCRDRAVSAKIVGSMNERARRIAQICKDVGERAGERRISQSWLRSRSASYVVASGKFGVMSLSGAPVSPHQPLRACRARVALKLAGRHPHRQRVVA